MKERFEIYDGSAEAKKAKGKSKNLSGFHPLFTAAARRSIALDALKIWLLLGFIVGVVTGVATGAGAVSILLGLLIAAVIYFGFRDDVYKKVYGPEHDRGQLPLPEGMSWEEAVDRIRRGFANPDVEQVTDTADAMTFYSKKRGTYQLKNTADGLKMTILTKPSKSSKKEYLYTYSELSGEISVDVSHYEIGEMPENVKEYYLSYGSDFDTAWLNALYTDVYEYSGKYSNQVAWERFTEYMVFYDEVVDYNNELAPAPALYDAYYAYDPATEEEAALCVDDVIQIAEESGAEIQIW